jgi:hypothetical protein
MVLTLSTYRSWYHCGVLWIDIDGLGNIDDLSEGTPSRQM